MPDFPIPIAITISPKQDMTRLKQPHIQHAKYAYPLAKLFKKFSSYYGRPELTISNLVHYHFLLSIEDEDQYVQWTRTTLPNMQKLGNIKVKIVHKEQGWLDYINKDKELYDKIFKNTWDIPIELTPETLKKYTKDKPMKNIPIEPLDEGINKIVKSITISFNS